MNYETYFTWIIILLVLLLAGAIRIYLGGPQTKPPVKNTA